MPSFAHLNRRYGPWASLALGVATVAYVRRGLGFAPVAVGVLMLAWIGAAALRRIDPVASADPAGISTILVPRWRRLVLPATVCKRSDGTELAAASCVYEIGLTAPHRQSTPRIAKSSEDEASCMARLRSVPASESCAM